MSPGDLSSPDSGHPPAAHYNLAASEDWQRLERLFDLNEGFALVCLFIDGEAGEAVCRTALEGRLRGESLTLLDISPSAPGDVRGLAQKLLDTNIPESTGAVWFGKVISAGASDYGDWAHAWREGLARANQFRNPVMRRIQAPLIVAGAPWLQPVFSEAAPDLWSIRSMVGRVAPVVEASAPPREEHPLPARGATSPDPALALAEADKYRGIPGNELSVARLLTRAGQGFLDRHQWHDAVGPLREALEIRRRAPAQSGDLAESCYQLSRALYRLALYEESTPLLHEAIRCFRQAQDPAGEARCLRALGITALAQARSSEASAWFSGALVIFRRIGDVAWQARCISGLGDAARNSGLLGEAAQRYMEALPLFHLAGSAADEGNLARALGEVLIRRGETDAGATYFEKALQLAQVANDPSGEIRAVRSMADIAAIRSNFPEALRLYGQAADMSRRIGDAPAEGDSEMGISNVLLRSGEPEAALSHVERALLIRREAKDRRAEAWALLRRGDIYRSMKNPASSRADFEAAALLGRETGDLLAQASAYERLGALEAGIREFAVAHSSYVQALALFEAAGELRGRANTTVALADLAARTGDKAEADRQYRVAGTLFGEAGNLRGQAQTFQSLGTPDDLKTAIDLFRRAGDRMGAAIALRRLAKATETGPQRRSLVDQAADEYREAGRPDLIEDLRREFPE